MRHLVTILFSLITVSRLFAQNNSLPIVYAEGGEGKKMVYKKLTQKEQDEIPGYVWNVCSNCISFEDCNIKSSSNLQKQGAENYVAKNIQDDDPTTAWIEGKNGYGIGEYIESKNVRLIFSIVIFNGYQKSPKSFIENSRVKSLLVSENGIGRCIIRLKDEMGRQFVAVEDLGLKYYSRSDFHDKPISKLKFTIMDVYPGTKFKNVAISELFSSGCCVSGQSKIILSNDEKKEIVDIKLKDSIKLLDNNNNIIYAFGAEFGSVVYDNLLEILTEKGNSIVMSPSHNVYVGSQNNKIQARQLSTTDSLIINNGENGIYLDKIKKINQIHNPTKTYYFKKLDFGNQTISWPIRAIFNNIIADDEYLDKLNKVKTKQ
jgi:hypothetical protein